ncbi:hypothetical protein ACH5RR_002984 [Cinchona calisaya]|uniref:Uncharacterized protein n=1 Tax=Cinchona calisaya TaxID=153742 RepID=A0ABD3ATN1_9GENT
MVNRKDFTYDEESLTVGKRPFPFRKDIINAHYVLPNMEEESEYARFQMRDIDYEERHTRAVQAWVALNAPHGEQTDQEGLWKPPEDIKVNYYSYTPETETRVRTIISYHSQPKDPKPLSWHYIVGIDESNEENEEDDNDIGPSRAEDGDGAGTSGGGQDDRARTSGEA